jgi:hypothetical protein
MTQKGKWYPRKTTEEERFWAKVDKTETCWMWTASKDRRGYGKFCVQRKIVPAHRYAYSLAHGAIPHGLFVCHKCDVPSCVNLEHLWLGSPSDNTADMIKKNRHGAHMKPRAGTHCKKGHEYSVVGVVFRKNTVVDSNGVSVTRVYRVCRQCRKDGEKRRRVTPERLERFRKYQREYQKRARHSRAK